MNNDLKILKSPIDLVKALKGFHPIVQTAIYFGFVFLVGYVVHVNHDVLMAIVGIVGEGCRTIETIILHLFLFFLLWQRFPLRRLALTSPLRCFRSP